ncbi:MAG: RsmE family RNA methyltransferase [Acidimicrobiia bacterium]
MPRITAAVAPPRRPARRRFVVEKLAELGTDELVWLDTTHGGSIEALDRKARAWSVGALEQSRGAWLMEIGGPVTFGQVATKGALLVADRDAPPPGTIPGGPIVVAIGPEGGFVAGEANVPGATFVGFGSRTLRVETAAVTAVSVVMYLTGRLGAGD